MMSDILYDITEIRKKYTQLEEIGFDYKRIADNMRDYADNIPADCQGSVRLQQLLEQCEKQVAYIGRMARVLAEINGIYYHSTEEIAEKSAEFTKSLWPKELIGKQLDEQQTKEFFDSDFAIDCGKRLPGYNVKLNTAKWLMNQIEKNGEE